MFSETQTITINSVDNALVRINQDGYASEYLLRGDSSEYRLRVRNTSYVRKGTSTRVDRHTVELTEIVYPAVAGDPSTNRKAYLVFENELGDDKAAVTQFVKGLAFYMQAETRLNQLQNWES